MRKKKKDIAIIIISMIVICMNHIVLSKYDYVANCNAQSEIAKSIFVLEKDEILKQQIDQNSLPMEYNFVIHNFENDKINEVDLDYRIEIDTSTENFPVSYFLFDCNNNTEIQLTEGKTEPLPLPKYEKQSRRFKLYLQWRELDSDLAESIEIHLKINAVQAKKGEKNENTTNHNDNAS